MAIREGKWKCPHCASVNRGRETSCPSCGNVRDASVKFFLEGDEPPVTAPKRETGNWEFEMIPESAPGSKHARFQFPVPSFQFPVPSFQFPVPSFQFPVPRSNVCLIRLTAVGAHP
jgi:hypothetical protein